MVKPYVPIRIEVNEHNADAIYALEKDREAIARASDTYRSATSKYTPNADTDGRKSPNQMTDKEIWRRFVGDSRELQLIGKTPDSFKVQAKNELSLASTKPGVARELSSTLLKNLVDTIASTPEARRAISFLCQQVGNDITSAVKENFVSVRDPYVFNHQCPPITDQNVLEIAGDPFNTAKKVSNSNYYYLVHKDDIASPNPRVMYIDINGVEKTDRLNKIKGKTLPIVMVTSEAVVQIDKNNKPNVKTSHTYQVQPEYLKWIGPDYPRSDRSYLMAQRFNNLRDSILIYATLIQNNDNKDPELLKSLTADLGNIQSDFPKLQALYREAQYLQVAANNANTSRRASFQKSFTNAVIKLQLAIAETEGKLLLSKDDIKIISKMLIESDAKLSNQENIPPKPLLMNKDRKTQSVTRKQDQPQKEEIKQKLRK